MDYISLNKMILELTNHVDFTQIIDEQYYGKNSCQVTQA